VDTLARDLGQQLSEVWGQSFIVENRTGAGGNIALQFVAKAQPDGYTIGTAHGGTHGANQSMYGAKMSFDPVKDFTPITMLAEMKNVLVVNADLGIKNLDQLLAYARANPGKLSFGSSGAGTVQHLTGELFKLDTGIDIVHVPYRGQAQALPDLLQGRISMMFLGAGAAAEHVRSGKLIAIGAASKNRSPLLPNVVPLAEQGLKGFDAVTWFGLVAPANMPKEILSAYYQTVSSILAKKEVSDKWRRAGMDVVPMTPQEFGEFIKSEIKKWSSVVERTQTRLE
jgi:tripartite-type tricarboxylate transporter receptor subunit TctC